MKKALFSVAVAMFFAAAAFPQIPQQYIWKITFVANSVGNSNITVQNRCKKSHEFRITGRNVPYLDFGQNAVTVAGGRTENVPVVVNTKNLDRRNYLGEVTLFCLTCANETGCRQSRDILNVTLNVVTADQLANYKPSKEIGIDGPIAITASPKSSSTSSGTLEEVKALLVNLSRTPGVTSEQRSASSCGIPQLSGESRTPAKVCKNCEKRRQAVEALKEKIRQQTELAEKYCLGLMQLENTTAFVEARASRAERQLSDASRSGSDEHVLISLRTEAENSKRDARVFRDKLEVARDVVDYAKSDAFALMQELDEAQSALDECVKSNPTCK